MTVQIQNNLGDSERNKIPLWKLVDGNYVYQGVDEIHHNGFLVKIPFSSFQLESEDTTDKPGVNYAIYSAPLNFVFSSMTFSAYFDPVGGIFGKFHNVETINAKWQTAIDGSRIYISYPIGLERDIYVSPSDFTRINANAEWVQGMSGNNTIVEGIKYNHDMCIGYFDSQAESLYNNDASIVSPGYINKTVADSRTLFYREGSAGVWTGDWQRLNPPPSSVYNDRRIGASIEDVTNLRSRMLSHVAFVRLGNVSGRQAGVYENVMSGVPCTFLAPEQIITANHIHDGTFDVYYRDGGLNIEVDFRSTNSGAYLKIRNNNPFDIFIVSLEIWGLWISRQSDSGEFGGAIHQSSFLESNVASKKTIESENHYVLTADQAKDIAELFLERATTMRHTITDLETPHARYLEIGDAFNVTIPEVSQTAMRFVIVGKNISNNKTSLTLKLTRSELSLANLQNAWKDYQVKRWSKTF